MNLKTSQYYLLIIALGALLFIPSLGSVHLFDWDEINFAECAREMLVSGNYWQVQIDYQLFWEKPPLFIWLQALSMKAFGINEFAARFPNAIVGIISLCFLFFVGKRLRNKKFATILTLVYAMSLLPHFYFKSGIIDPVFNLFIYVAIYFFNASVHHRRKKYYAILSGLCLGLAVLTKGPVALMLVGLAFICFCALNNFWKKINFSNLLILSTVCLAVICVWVLPNYILGGAELFNDFINYQIRLLTTQDAGHGGPIYYHIVVLLFGCFPASIFLFQKNHNKQSLSANERDFYLWNVILLSVTLIVFSLVKTKIVHYSSLCYFPIVYLAANSIYNLIYKKNKINVSTSLLFWLVGGLLAIALIMAPIVMMQKAKWIHLVKDPFAIENLNASVDWSYLHSISGIILLLGLIGTLFLFRKKDYQKGFAMLSLALIICMQTAFRVFPSKIEKISQGAALQFCEENQERIIKPLGYKSYAHLFYGKKKTNYPIGTEEIYLVKKPYFQEEALENSYEVLKEKNGFLLLRQK